MTESVRLGELASDEQGSFVDGPFGSNLKASEYIDAGVPIIRLQNIRSHEFLEKDIKFISMEKAEQLARHSYRPGDVVIAKLGDPTGVACLVPESMGQGRIVADVVRFRGDPKRVHHSYISRYLNSPDARLQLDQGTTGTTRKRINLTKLKAVKIPLPPLPEQKRIAKILDAADALRAKRRESLAQLDALLQSTFLEMFGDPVENPKGWEMMPIGDFCTVKGGKRLPKGEDYSEVATEFRYIRVSDLRPNQVLTEDLKFLKPETQRQIARYIVNLGDVIISIAGSIGITAPVPAHLDGVNLTENAAKIVPQQKNKVNPVYLSYALQSQYAQDQIRGQTGQVTIGKLALFRIEKIVVAVPPVEEQDRFSSFADAVASQRQLLMGHFQELDYLFGSLQDRAFAGQL